MPNKWVIEEYNGNIDVRRNGRAFRYDLDDVEEAVRLIRRSPKFDPGDQVTVVDQDGYRRSLRVT